MLFPAEIAQHSRAMQRSSTTTTTTAWMRLPWHGVGGNGEDSSSVQMQAVWYSTRQGNGKGHAFRQTLQPQPLPRPLQQQPLASDGAPPPQQQLFASVCASTLPPQPQPQPQNPHVTPWQAVIHPPQHQPLTTTGEVHASPSTSASPPNLGGPSPELECRERRLDFDDDSSPQLDLMHAAGAPRYYHGDDAPHLQGPGSGARPSTIRTYL